MNYIKLPISQKIENKFFFFFYLNIEKPFRGTSKFRGIQIFYKLLTLGYDYKDNMVTDIKTDEEKIWLESKVKKNTDDILIKKLIKFMIQF